MQSIKKTRNLREANGMPAAPKTQTINHKALLNIDLNIFKINMLLKEFRVRSKGRL
jgi:hypothetical protein